MRVSWHLLGPIEVRVDGSPVAPPPPASRALLARLLLSAGRVVPAEHLIDLLWGEDLPSDPPNALQTRVAKLRRALTASGVDASLVRTRAPGYVIDVDPSCVDALDFERRLAVARGAMTRDDERATLRTYEEALAMWAGPALADLSSSPWVDAERVRLDELRLAATEERLELLSVATPETAVPELEALVARHPLREGLTRRLMVALYRQGRQADALDAYERLRQTLAEELGLDPAPELQGLAQAILRQEPSLGGDRTAAAGSPPRGGVPERQTTFVGRESEMEELVALTTTTRLLTLTGMGGLGKTSLALEVARRIERTTPRDVYVVRLATLDRDGDVAGALAEQLSVPVPPGGSPLERVTATLAPASGLLLVDNCEHVVDAVAFVVEHILTRCPDLSILATSREALAVPGEVQWPVAPLAVEASGPPGSAAAVRLFLDRSRQAAPALVLDEAALEEVTGICRDLDGVPLALELAAARTKMFPPAQLRSMISERLDVLGVNARGEDGSSLRATLDWSYEMLSPRERLLLERLSVFQGGWTLSAAERVCAGGRLDAHDILSMLTGLVDRSLVIADPLTGRFRMLVTVRHYAWERLCNRSDFHDVVGSHLTWCLDFADQHEPMLRQGTGYPVFLGEAANLRAALTRSLDARTRDIGRGMQLAVSMVWFWYQGLRDEGVRTLEELLATGEGEERARAGALQGLGLLLVYYPTPRSQAAARESLVLFQQLGDEIESAKSRLIVAQEAMYGTGDAEPYRKMIEESRRVLQDLDSGWWEAITFYLDALIHLRDAEFSDVVGKGERAIELLRPTGDVASLSAALSHVGLALRMSGDLPTAEARLREALAVLPDAPARHTGAFALVHLGHVCLDRGDPAEAGRCFDEGEGAARQVANPRCQAWAAWGRARLAAESSDQDAARREAQLATELLAGREFPWALQSLAGFVAQLHGGAAHISSTHDRGMEASPLDS